MPRRTPDSCPACGENVPRNAPACPHCGADERTGWNEDATATDGLDLPDDDLDYDAFMEREFGVTPPRKRRLAAIAILLLLALLFWFFRR